MRIEWKRKSLPNDGNEEDFLEARHIYAYLSNHENVRFIKKRLIRRLRRSQKYITQLLKQEYYEDKQDSFSGSDNRAIGY